MVKISEGEGPQKVPLVYYDMDGNRTVVGEAAIQIQNGEVIALGKLSRGDLNFSVSNLSLEAFSIDTSKAGVYEPSPAERASARLGVLSRGDRRYATNRNPDGNVRPCTRDDTHSPHEYPLHPADFFDVYCPGRTKPHA